MNVTQREEPEIYGIKLQIASEVPRDTWAEMNRRSISCISMLKSENTDAVVGFYYSDNYVVLWHTQKLQTLFFLKKHELIKVIKRASSE